MGLIWALYGYSMGHVRVLCACLTGALWVQYGCSTGHALRVFDSASQADKSACDGFKYEGFDVPHDDGRYDWGQKYKEWTDERYGVNEELEEYIRNVHEHLDSDGISKFSQLKGNTMRHLWLIDYYGPDLYQNLNNLAWDASKNKKKAGRSARCIAIY